MLTMNMNMDFPHCHPDIASILACPRPNDKHRDCSSKSYLSFSDYDVPTLAFPNNGTTNDLVLLSHECDDYFYYNATSAIANAGDMSTFLNTLREFSALLHDDDGDDDENGNGNGTNDVSSNRNNNDDKSGEVRRTRPTTKVAGAKTVIATLLALNALETTIRHSTGYKAGHAPLLKTMVTELQTICGPGICRVCELLLLPTGINLRNLLWHGFVGSIPRPWLSLVVLLTSLIAAESSPSHQALMAATPRAEIMDFREKKELKRLLKFTAPILIRPPSNEVMKNWLPSSHWTLWGIATKWIKERRYPVTLCALLSILLEHGLRLDWCRNNQRNEDACARPGVFYVTLDGHGQRHVHDLLLHPFVRQQPRQTPEQTQREISDKRNGNSQHRHGVERNAMFDDKRNVNNNNNNKNNNNHIDGPTIALLTDLFCSSCGGPNIRATIAHGTWDTLLTREWAEQKMKIETNDGNDISKGENGNADVNFCIDGGKWGASQQKLWDHVQLVLVVMEWVASSSSRASTYPYQPIFSYTAVSRANLWEATTSITNLQNFHRDDGRFKHYLSIARGVFGDVDDEIKSLDCEDGTSAMLDQLLLDFDPLLSSPQQDDVWSVEDVYKEHELNHLLAGAGATRRLLEEISTVTCSHMEHVRKSLQNLATSDSDDNDAKKLDKRKRKTALRIIHSSQTAKILYTFALHVAILSLKRDVHRPVSTNGSVILPDDNFDGAVLLKAVERTRMVVSTVDNFLYAKVDRAIKSAKEYAKGKAIKYVIAHRK